LPAGRVVIRLLLGGGALGAAIATWSPVVEALAVLSVVDLLLIVTHSKERTKRAVTLIRAFRGGGGGRKGGG
jgi:hypothetical protein